MSPGIGLWGILLSVLETCSSTRESSDGGLEDHELQGALSLEFLKTARSLDSPSEGSEDPTFYSVGNMCTDLPGNGLKHQRLS